MKRFWKRVNRGLVLAAVILAGLIIFIQIDQYQFKSAKPEIEQMTREYLARVSENNKLEPEKRMEQTRLLLAEYWKDSRANGMGVPKQTMENYLAAMEHTDFEKLEDYVDRIESVEVKKSGPRAASVTVEYEVTLKGSKQISSYGIYGLETSWYSDMGSGGTKSSESRMYEISLLMTQEKSGWKITSISSSYELAGAAENDQDV